MSKKSKHRKKNKQKLNPEILISEKNQSWEEILKSVFTLDIKDILKKSNNKRVILFCCLVLTIGLGFYIYGHVGTYYSIKSGKDISHGEQLQEIKKILIHHPSLEVVNQEIEDKNSKISKEGKKQLLEEYKLGTQAYNDGNYELAAKKYKEALKINSEPSINWALGNCYQKIFFRIGNTTNFEKAMKQYEIALEQYKTQKKHDSEILTMQAMSNLYLTKKDIENALKIIQEASNIQKVFEKNNTYLEALLASTFGEIYSMQGKDKMAFEALNKAIELFESIDDKDGVRSTLISYAIILKRLGHLNECIIKFNEILKMVRDEDEVKADTLYNLSLIYYNKRDFKKALNYLLEAQKLYEDAKNKDGITSVLNSLGSVYLAFFIDEKLNNKKKQDYLKEAEKYTLNAVEILKNFGKPIDYAFTLKNIGYIELIKGNYKESEDNYNEALKILETEKNELFIGMIYNHLGNLYRNKNELEKAIEFYEKGFKYNKKNNDLENILRSCHGLATIYFLIGKKDKAKYYQSIAEKIIKTTDFKSEEFIPFFKELKISINELSFNKNGEATFYLADNFPITIIKQKGVEQDDLKAIELYKKTCDRGEAQACHNLGNMYYHGKGVEQDDLKAIELYKKACDRGEAQACHNLGNMYYQGKGVEQDDLKAIELYKKACDRGEAQACHNLGNMYYQGKGVEQDDLKAIELCIKACDGGEAQACFTLGWLYHEGERFKQDYFKAIEFYTKACDRREARACHNLGNMYSQGEGVKQDYFKAIEFYTKACDRGEARACSYLGNMYYQGKGVKQDYFKAIEFYTKACDRGEARACSYLGNMYYQGKGVKQDYFKAVKFYKKACDGKYSSGCYNLGIMYYTGEVVKQDYFKAVELYEKACYGGEAQACSYLGNMYNQGKGVEQDKEKAIEFFTMACDGGLGIYCYNLGVMYYKGEGVRKDIQKAKDFFDKACNNKIRKGCWYAMIAQIYKKFITLLK
ncbi:MAG: SEL1-like repeat protein [Desulfobacterales bacterium]|nr:SEL1-like repeat protein [Desulfobacterales bacterium]